MLIHNVLIVMNQSFALDRKALRTETLGAELETENTPRGKCVLNAELRVQSAEFRTRAKCVRVCFGVRVCF